MVTYGLTLTTLLEFSRQHGPRACGMQKRRSGESNTAPKLFSILMSSSVNPSNVI